MQRLIDSVDCELSYRSILVSAASHVPRHLLHKCVTTLGGLHEDELLVERQEVQYYEKMEVRDIHNDMPLAAACQTDVERFCGNIKSGAGFKSGCAALLRC
jgi:hypothetical protein